MHVEIATAYKGSKCRQRAAPRHLVPGGNGRDSCPLRRRPHGTPASHAAPAPAPRRPLRPPLAPLLAAARPVADVRRGRVHAAGLVKRPQRVLHAVLGHVIQRQVRLGRHHPEARVLRLRAVRAVGEVGGRTGRVCNAGRSMRAKGGWRRRARDCGTAPFCLPPSGPGDPTSRPQRRHACCPPGRSVGGTGSAQTWSRAGRWR